MFVVLALLALLPSGCTTQTGEWNWSVGPLFTNEPDELTGRPREPVDMNQWQRYYRQTETSGVPAKAESPQ